MKENSLAWNLQRDEFLQCWKFKEFIFQILCSILITLAKERDKVGTAITSPNFIIYSFWVHHKDLFYALSSF